MSSSPKAPGASASLEALLAAVARGEIASGEIVRYLRPSGVLGTLTQMPLTEILQNMDFGKKSGRVDVWVDGVEGSVTVHDGQIVHAMASTVAGHTEGESAILEICRRPGGFFCIDYGRADVDRNVHRPTTFVLLEALRVIDEASASRDENEDDIQTLPGGNVPAAVDLGLGPPRVEPALDVGFDADPWADKTNSSVFPPDADDDEPNPFNDPSAVLDIEVAAAADATQQLQQHPRYRVAVVIPVVMNDRVVPILLEDIGKGGAFLRVENAPPRGSTITLRLPTSDGNFDVPARIIHVLDRSAAETVSREPGIGVRFDDLPAAVSARLDAYIDKLAPHTGGGGKNMSPRERLRNLVAESEFLVAAGDLESAQRVLSQAQGLAPDDDEIRRKLLSVNESIDAMRANRFLEQAMRGGPQAVDFAQRAIQLRPTRDVLLRSLAVFARGGAHEEMADVAEQLLELDPDDEGALRVLLDANIAMEAWTVAARAVESLLRLRPEDQQLQATRQKVVAMARRK